MLTAGRNSGLKPRGERVSVVLQARMQSGSGWDDARILNVSSRGLMIHSPASLQPGSYVEIRRGGQEIVARVVWRRDNRMGLMARERIHVAQLISGQAVRALQVTAGPNGIERPSVARAAARNRERGRMAEFVGIGLFAAAFAIVAYNAVTETLVRSLAHVNVTLRGG